MSLINVSANGNSLQKTAGCAGCPDATAVSEAQISGHGSFEFVASESGSLRFVGLGAGGIGMTAADLNFALRLQSGVAEVRESGGYKTEVPFSAGDRFQIAVEGGAVRYARNGAVFYTSATQASFALRAHAVLFDMSAAISGVTLGGVSGGSSTPAPVAGAGGAASSAEPIRYAQRRPEGSAPQRR